MADDSCGLDKRPIITSLGSLMFGEEWSNFASHPVIRKTLSTFLPLPPALVVELGLLTESVVAQRVSLDPLVVALVVLPPLGALVLLAMPHCNQGRKPPSQFHMHTFNYWCPSCVPSLQ